MKNKDLNYLKLIRECWDIATLRNNIIFDNINMNQIKKELKSSEEFEDYKKKLLNNMPKEKELLLKELDREAIYVADQIKELGFEDSFNKSLNSKEPITKTLDNMPTYYAFVKTYKSNKGHRWVLDINGQTYQVMKDTYLFLDHIKNRPELKFKEFHGLELLDKLYYNNTLDNLYSKFGRVFGEKKKLKDILFEYSDSDKGYWKCKVDIWF